MAFSLTECYAEDVGNDELLTPPLYQILRDRTRRILTGVTAMLFILLLVLLILMMGGGYYGYRGGPYYPAGYGAGGLLGLILVILIVLILLGHI